MKNHQILILKSSITTIIVTIILSNIILPTTAERKPPNHDSFCDNEKKYIPHNHYRDHSFKNSHGLPPHTHTTRTSFVRVSELGESKLCNNDKKIVIPSDDSSRNHKNWRW